MVAVEYQRGVHLPDAGLWLDPQALIKLDLARVLHVLQQGLETPAHSAFIARLAENATGRGEPG